MKKVIRLIFILLMISCTSGSGDKKTIKKIHVLQAEYYSSRDYEKRVVIEDSIVFLSRDIDVKMFPGMFSIRSFIETSRNNNYHRNNEGVIF